MSELLSERKPINFTSKEVEDTKKLVALRNSKKSKNEKKDTFNSVIRDMAIIGIRKELKQIEKGQ